MTMSKRLAKTWSASSEYIRYHGWLWWAFGILACAVLSVSHASSQDYLWDHTSILLLLPLPGLLVTWLVAGAEDARERLRAGPSCRRR
jgi:NhaP-type Na+/H+ or K+/H+ antiporter